MAVIVYHENTISAVDIQFAPGDLHPYRLSLKSFGKLLQAALRELTFDEDFYLRRNPDIGEAIEDGVVASGFDHYIEHGFMEGRLPCRLMVDEDFYLVKYKDVASAIRSNHFESAQAHFEEFGFAEGRLPYEGFCFFDRRRTAQDVVQAIRAPQQGIRMLNRSRA